MTAEMFRLHHGLHVKKFSPPYPCPPLQVVKSLGPVRPSGPLSSQFTGSIHLENIMADELINHYMKEELEEKPCAVLNKFNKGIRFIKCNFASEFNLH